MKENKSLRAIAIALIMLPILIILVRIHKNGGFTALGGDYKYIINYEFNFQSDALYKITTFLPVNNRRQEIHLHNSGHMSAGSVFLDGPNKLIQWRGSSDDANISCQFEFRGKPVAYLIRGSLTYEPRFSGDLEEYLSATQFIQSDDPRIRELATELSGQKTRLVEIIQAFYDFVYQIPSSSSSEFTDALMALDRREASCNGKSRLFVSLCRSMGIPARVVGGLILEETAKKTSHSWIEILIEDTWVPFDALNGYFASLPAHYLELYRGDHFLITRNKDLMFDYLYVIKKDRVYDYPVFAVLNIWQLMDDAGIAHDMFKMLLLLPFGAFLVAVFKNVIGFKTYGVFLPVLISLSLLETGLVPGLLLFTIIIAVVVLVNFPLTQWHIQYNAKISLMLIAVVITALLAIQILHTTGWLVASAPLFFPIIILTIISERMARKIEEEGTRNATELYVTTLLVTVLIYFVLSSEFIQHFVLTFPEIILTIAGINLLLGKWIGLRVMEYYRFLNVTSS
ncbi:7TM domain-containing protein [Fulvivirgaceae bacterium BMA12]|uniref:7TM domain-containing protein n=1 Tax=Agaribacillus aureus TaxID=3051825 RepID=A0ABT8LA88_9BACT|nr:7TM domain-containing protein [Fulvivirgaceae bacterium BMA12]